MNYKQKLQTPPENKTIKETFEEFKRRVLLYVQNNDRQKDEDYPVDTYRRLDKEIREKVFIDIFVKESFQVINEIFAQNYMLENDYDIQITIEKILNRLIKNEILHKTITTKIDKIIDDYFDNKITKQELTEIYNVEKDALKDSKNYLSSTNKKHIRLIVKARAEITISSYIVLSLIYLIYDYIPKYFVSLSIIDQYKKLLRRLKYTYTNISEQFTKYAFVKNYRYGLSVIQHAAIEEDYNVRIQMRTLILKAHYNNPDFSDKTLLYLALKYMLTSQVFKNNFFKVRKLILYLRILYNKAAFVVLGSLKVDKIIDTEQSKKYKYMVYNGPINTIETFHDEAAKHDKTDEIDDDLDLILDENFYNTLFKIQDNLTLELFKIFGADKKDLIQQDNNKYDLKFHITENIYINPDIEKKIRDYLNSIEFLLTKISLEYDYLKKQYIIQDNNIQLYIKPQINIFWLIENIRDYLYLMNSATLIKNKHTQLIKFIDSLDDKLIVNNYKNYTREIKKVFNLFSKKQERALNNLYNLIKHSYQITITIDELNKNTKVIKQLRNKFDMLNNSRIYINHQRIQKFINHKFKDLKPYEQIIIQLANKHINNSVFIVPYIDYIIPIQHISKTKFKKLTDYIVYRLLNTINDIVNKK